MFDESVSGAVLQGLESNQVQSRIARCHYGLSLSEPFDPHWHRGHCQEYWCKYEESWRVSGIMDWLINRVQFSPTSWK